MSQSQDYSPPQQKLAESLAHILRETWRKLPGYELWEAAEFLDGMVIRGNLKLREDNKRKMPHDQLAREYPLPSIRTFHDLNIAVTQDFLSFVFRLAKETDSSLCKPPNRFWEMVRERAYEKNRPDYLKMARHCWDACYIPAVVTGVDSFFSVAKYYFSSLQKRVDNSTATNLLFLKANGDVQRKYGGLLPEWWMDSRSKTQRRKDADPDALKVRVALDCKLFQAETPSGEQDVLEIQGAEDEDVQLLSDDDDNGVVVDESDSAVSEECEELEEDDDEEE